MNPCNHEWSEWEEADGELCRYCFLCQVIEEKNAA